MPHQVLLAEIVGRERRLRPGDDAPAELERAWSARLAKMRNGRARGTPVDMLFRLDA